MNLLQPATGQQPPDAEASTTFRVFTVDELRALELPQVQWLVEDLIPAGSLALLVGRPKVGKSLLAIDLLASVASGQPFLGYETTPGTALYVPAEDALDLVRERLDLRIGDRQGVPLVVAPSDGSFNQSIRLDQSESFGRLARTVLEMEPGLVVLDPFRELHLQPENEAEAMAGILRPLRQLAHRSRCAVVLVHHRNKYASDPSLATRGSSAIAGSVDLTITLDSAGGEASGEDGQALGLRIEGRYGPRRLLGARLCDGLRWTPADVGSVSGHTIHRRILGYLRDADARPTATELARELALADKTVRNALSELGRTGKLLRSGAGTKADPYRYRAAGESDGQAGPRQAQLVDSLD